MLEDVNMSTCEKLPKLPSDRYFAIYYQVAVMNQRQRDVALACGVTKGRVSQIIRQVRTFVDEFAPGRRVPPKQRMFLARFFYHLVQQGFVEEQCDPEFAPQEIAPQDLAPAEAPWTAENSCGEVLVGEFV